MTTLMVGYMSIVVLLIMLASGIPVGVALGLAGMAGMYVGLSEALALGQIRTLPYSVTSNYGFAVLPLFVLMGIVAEKSGMSAMLFKAADMWLRSLKGGLYQVVIVGSAVFAAISGSTVVNAIVFTRIAFPEMLRNGYSRSLSIGCIAGAGGFAAMIPPSITMVIYAIMTEQSIGQMFLAGIVPGIMSAVAYVIAIGVIVRIWPNLAPPITSNTPLRDKLRSLTWAWPFAAVFVVVMGGLYSGLFPASGAGAVGAVAAIAIGVLYTRGRFSHWLPASLRDTVIVTSVVFLILIGGLLFSRMLVALGVINHLVSFLQDMQLTQLQFMIGASIILIVLGCVLDTTSMMVVTLPFLFPISQEVGADPIWFGIIVVKVIEISVITPPVGMNLFAVMSAVDKDTTFSHVVRGITPFLIIELILLAILIAFPLLSVGLPRMLMPGTS